MDRHKVTVRAQRKFAKNQSGKTFLASEKDPEPEQEQRAKPIFKKCNVPVGDFLDHVCYSGIHLGHQNEKGKTELKDVRVILNRLPPPRSIAAIQSVQNSVPQLCNVNQQPPRCGAPSDAGSVAPSIMLMRLRNRAIKRPLTEDLHLAKRGSDRKSRKISASSSDSATSVEDYHPLTYFANRQNMADKSNYDKSLSQTPPEIHEIGEKSQPVMLKYNTQTAKRCNRKKSLKKNTNTYVTRNSRSEQAKSVVNNGSAISINNNNTSVPSVESTTQPRSPKNKSCVVRRSQVKTSTTRATNSSSKYETEKQNETTTERRCSKRAINKPESKSSCLVANTHNMNANTNVETIKLKRNTINADQPGTIPHYFKSHRQSTIRKKAEGNSCSMPLLRNRRATEPEPEQSCSNNRRVCDQLPASHSKGHTISYEEPTNIPTTLESPPDDCYQEINNSVEATIQLPNTSNVHTLSGFIKSVFNWVPKLDDLPAGQHRVMDIDNESGVSIDTEAESVQTEATYNQPTYLAQQKVQDWLKQQEDRGLNHEVLSSTSKPNESEFKVPAPPQPRNIRVFTPCPSLITSERAFVAIPRQEIHQRELCIAWKYEKFGSIVDKPEMIQQFCTECTRCKIIFRPLNIFPKDFCESVASLSSSEGYLDLDGETNMDAKSLLDNISTKPNHLTRIKEFMTFKGRKIFKVALLLKDHLDKGKELSQNDQMILIQVLGFLMESNWSPTATTGMPLNKDCHNLQNQDNPRNSSNSLCANIANSGVPTKHTRQLSKQLENKTQSSTSSVINAPGSIKESIVLNATELNFEQSPVEFSIYVKERYPQLSFCGIKPPSFFKPTCNINDNQSRLKLRNQYINRMLYRWHAATKELTVIRSLNDPKTQRTPLFEGLEIDLVRLYHAVQDEKGLLAFTQDVNKWSLVSRKMNLPDTPKTETKLEMIYIKYILDYESMSPVERCKAEAKVLKCWEDRQKLAKNRAENVLQRKLQYEEERPVSQVEVACAEAEDCVAPGRSVNLSCFKKLAQRVQDIYFPGVTQPTAEQVEKEYWRIVTRQYDNHVCVHSSSIDALEHGYGFTRDTADQYHDHPWNLKILALSPSNVLSHLGHTVGVSPTLHYGMTFSTSCWHMDPTMVPYIEYLHCGTSKIWYSISADQCEKFREAAEKLCPYVVQKKKVWLPCDIMMISPSLLKQHGLHVQRHVQFPGEYVIVFPNTYYACLDTGFSVSEGVYFAPSTWISNSQQIFKNLRLNCEPSLFPLEKLLIKIAEDRNTSYMLFKEVQPLLQALLDQEMTNRQWVINHNIEMLTPQAFKLKPITTSLNPWQVAEHAECVFCRCTLFLSRIIGLTDGKTAVCIEDGILLYEKRLSKRKKWTLTQKVYCITSISKAEIEEITEVLHKRRLSRTEPVVS